MIKLEQVCTDVQELAKQVAHYISSQNIDNISSDVITKSKNSFVSFVDIQAEKKIINQLKLILPEAGFIAEEQTNNKIGEKFNWIIDPLDGTTNFLHNIPCYCISIALQQEDEIILGIVLEINNNECFWSIKNGGAYLDKNRIFVSKNNSLKDSLLATGFPYYDYEQIDAYLALLKELMQTTRGIRRLGSAAADLAYVACGRFEGFFEYSLSPWDVAAGALLVKEAGGSVSDFGGGDNFIFGRQIVATNNFINEEIMLSIKNHLT
jgi:myo-inositol-1(or 4)-monophosphatase